MFTTRTRDGYVVCNGWWGSGDEGKAKRKERKEDAEINHGRTDMRADVHIEGGTEEDWQREHEEKDGDYGSGGAEGRRKSERKIWGSNGEERERESEKKITSKMVGGGRGLVGVKLRGSGKDGEVGMMMVLEGVRGEKDKKRGAGEPCAEWHTMYTFTNAPLPAPTSLCYTLN